jgi:hypothetical protein
MEEKNELEINNNKHSSLPLFIKRGEFKKQVKSVTYKPHSRRILYYKRISSILNLNKIDVP